MFKNTIQKITTNRFSINSTWLILICALYFSSVLNLSFWRYFYKNVEISGFSSILFFISFHLVIFIVLYLLFSLIIWPYIGKPLLILLLLTSSATNYLMVQYNVYIDADMIRNVIQTNQREAFDLVTVSGTLWIFFLGVIPSLLVFFTRIKYKPILKELRFRIIANMAGLLVFAGIAGVSYKEYASFGRNNDKVTRLINTSNYIYATSRYLKKQYLTNTDFLHLDPNAEHQPLADPYPTVFILVVGETARAKNFSLNGYERETNPLLAKEELINFRDVASCGTATAISLPCMFSNLPRTEHDSEKAFYRENLIDILQKSDYTVWWRENDDGCKGVCNRVPTQDMVKTNNKKYCDDKACYDDVLLEGLEEYLKNVKKDTFIVLHTMGSHGPTYYKRYPDKFKKFTPTCDTAEIQNCSQEAIINTYDNTILYTDYILASTINILKKFPHFESGLLYVSDHGESLGENNLYLHGLPYSMAPDEQKKVPMILWMSENMKKYDHIDYARLKSNAKTQSYSHDHLFHSLIGLMEIKSELYDPAYDLFSTNRTKDLPANFLHK